MSDLTRCLNNECPIHGLCKRFHWGRIIIGTAYTSFKFEFNSDGTGEQTTCAEFVDKYKPVTDSEK